MEGDQDSKIACMIPSLDSLAWAPGCREVVSHDTDEYWSVLCACDVDTVEVSDSVIVHPTGKSPENRTRIENRFWSKVDVKGDDECWKWKRSSQRYGRFWLAGDNVLAHRVAFMLWNDLDSLDDIPGQSVKHQCHQTVCCNPRHLQVGSQSSNLIEACIEGDRETRFTDDEIREINRLARSPGITQRAIAEEFGVSDEMISGIVREKYYSWVDDD